MKKEIEEALRRKIEEGASYEKDGRVIFRLLDIQRYLQETHQVKLCQSGIWYILKDLGLSWISVRPKRLKTDDGVIEAFKKTSKQKQKK